MSQSRHPLSSSHRYQNVYALELCAKSGRTGVGQAPGIDRQCTLRWANWTAGEPTATAAEVANHAVVLRLRNSLPSPNLPISELQRRRCCKHACIQASMVYTPSITARLGCRCAHLYQPWILMRGAVVLCCVRRAKICLGHSTDSATSQSQGDAQRAHEPPWLERLLGCSEATCCRRQQEHSFLRNGRTPRTERTRRGSLSTG